VEKGTGGEMLTQDAFTEHKADYTIYRKTPVQDIYGNETNTYTAGGTINVMWTPIIDEASITLYGERINTMMQAIVYDSTEIQAHDQVVIDNERYEIISIKKYPSYRLIQVGKI